MILQGYSQKNLETSEFWLSVALICDRPNTQCGVWDLIKLFQIPMVHLKHQNLVQEM